MTNSTKYVRKELRELIKQNPKYKISLSPDEFPECIDGRDKTLCLYDYAGLILKAKEINIHG